MLRPETAEHRIITHERTKRREKTMDESEAVGAAVAGVLRACWAQGGGESMSDGADGAGIRGGGGGMVGGGGRGGDSGEGASAVAAP